MQSPEIIDSAADLAHRLGIDHAQLALAEQTTRGGAKEFLRTLIATHGPSVIHGRSPAGKAETYAQAWERVFNAKFEKRGK